MRFYDDNHTNTQYFWYLLCQELLKYPHFNLCSNDLNGLLIYFYFIICSFLIHGLVKEMADTLLLTDTCREDRSAGW